MRGKHACFLGRIAMIAGIVIPFLAAQTARRHAGDDVRTIDLPTHPDSMVLAAARKAFLQGDIVRIVGGRPEDLQRLLGIGGATITPGPPAVAHNPFDIWKLTARTPVYQIVAARATRTGALHEFQQLGMEAIAVRSSVQLAVFATWAEKERRLAQKEETGSSPGDTEPRAQAWTELQQTTFNASDGNANFFQNTVSIYRLNDTSLSFDWYMVLTDPESTPHYQGCNGFDCGWWTDQRVFTMSTNPQAVLFDHGPLNKITTSTAGFTIGSMLNAVGLGVNATYSENWQQPSVTTTDESDLVNGVGKWDEAFQGNGFAGTPPPETSIGLFLSHQGSIFQVPEGTTSLQFSLDEPLTYEYAGFGYSYSTSNPFLQVNISPPIFETSLNGLFIPPGGSGSFEITAVNPSTSNSALGLPWDVTNIPEWLTVSQISGSSSARLILNVAPGTALGTVASINVDTDPKYAAPSVEKSSLLVRVTVGQPNETGVMLTGGSDAKGGVQNVADLYSPQLGQFDLEAAMQSQRTEHTATLLLSGKLLLAGGATGPKTATATAELFDPDTAQFSLTAGMMTDSRESHTATLLQNGTVLLAGGLDNSGLAGGDSLATAELYDPNTGTFAATGSMGSMRANHSSTALLDGEVLVAGGQVNITLDGSVINTAEVYDPNTGRFTATAGNLVVGVFGHTATRLKNGQVLIAGGFDGTEPSAAAELYNPGTRTFSAVGNLNVARIAHTATLLDDGTVLITGGRDAAGNPLASAELYNPETQTFTLLSGGACPGSSGCMTAARASHSATLLLDGTVLIACGLISDQRFLGSTEIYNPQTKTFSAGPTTTPKSGHTATLLQRAPTTVALTSSSNPSTAGQRITLTATVATGDGLPPTGFVAFEDGTDVLANVPIQSSNKGVATFSLSSLTVGPHNLTAKYSGDAGHGKSTSSIVVQTVKSEATRTTLRSSPNPSNEGQLVTFVATVTASSGMPTGSVTFRNNGASLDTVGLTGNMATYSTSSLPPGGNPITATYNGDPTFASSGSQVLTQNVAKLSSTVVVTSSPNPSSFGQGVLIKATVTTTGNPPSGFVDFRDRNAVLQRVPLMSGVASFTDSNLGVGSHSITGIYSGDATHASATSSPLHQVVNKASTTTVLTSAPNPSKVGEVVTFTATVSSSSGRSPNGVVRFLDGTSALGRAPLTSGVAVLRVSTLASGPHNITASYGGNLNFPASVSPVVVQTVAGLVTPTVALTVAPSRAGVGSTVTFRARVSYPGGPVPTGSVTVSDVANGNAIYGVAPLNNGIGVVMNSTIPVGSYNLIATYGGDGGSRYNGATSNSVPLRIVVGRSRGPK
jgi:hypothetical protein